MQRFDLITVYHVLNNKQIRTKCQNIYEQYVQNNYPIFDHQDKKIQAVLGNNGLIWFRIRDLEQILPNFNVNSRSLCKHHNCNAFAKFFDIPKPYKPEYKEMIEFNNQSFINHIGLFITIIKQRQKCVNYEFDKTINDVFIPCIAYQAYRYALQDDKIAMKKQHRLMNLFNQHIYIYIYEHFNGGLKLTANYINSVKYLTKVKCKDPHKVLQEYAISNNARYITRGIVVNQTLRVVIYNLNYINEQLQ